jgi:CRISPR/Cas system CMR subunit Cmr4 (Cas7 group RAMP superfamily)
VISFGTDKNHSHLGAGVVLTHTNAVLRTIRERPTLIPIPPLQSLKGRSRKYPLTQP